MRCRLDLIQFLRAEYVTFPDANEESTDVVCEGDKVAVGIRFRGTQSGSLGTYSASGNALDSTYLAIYRVRKEHMVEAWVEWDNLASLRQLDHIRKAV